MRKRLIGKAFAIAMSGAMVLTATPVTANIFNVAQIVKAAEKDATDGYHYCYVGLTWAEYWENEGVEEATNTNSSDVLDGHKEYDKGGFDAVTRATVNHGISRASFQSMFTIHATDADGKDHYFDIAGFKSGSSISTDFVLYGTDGKEYAVHKGTDAKTITCDSVTYTFVDYQIKGTKYVPVKVSNDDWADFSKQYEGKIIENDGTLNCGSTGEGQIGNETYTASVDATTQGLKVATKNSDGTFSFSKRANDGTTSGLKDQSLKKATKLTPQVKVASGSYGEFLRVDFTGADYGSLGAHMQAVKWTYYGSDNTRTKALASYGTKFAADNWMHSKQGIQLGLTDSIRCQLPAGTDGTGYWSLTIYALGYEDYTLDFYAKAKNIVYATNDESVDTSKLQAVVDTAKAIDSKDYCANDAWDAFQDELTFAETYIASPQKQVVVDEAVTDLNDTLKAITKHDIETITTPATTDKEGSIVEKCKNCDKVFSTKTIAKLPATTTTTAAPTTTTTASKTTTVKAPAKTTVKLSKAKKTSLKVTWKKVSGAAAYQIQYSTSKNFKKAKTIKVSAKSASKVLTKLKKNKKYYVRVRSYKVTKVNNKSKNVYSAWSAKKSLKTKKK